MQFTDTELADRCAIEDIYIFASHYCTDEQAMMKTIKNTIPIYELHVRIIAV